MKKILVVCGPTATGKTSLALYLAEKFDGELVSADSRQVYRGMDIGTGKDVPQGSRWNLAKFPVSSFQFPIGFWETKNQIKMWCYDLVDPKEEFSVGQYAEIAEKIIKDIRRRGKLPILVGGTGLYIKSLSGKIPTKSIKRNKNLRKTLEKKDIAKLFEILARLDPTRAAGMNISDKNNPRRLVRAIEIADAKLRGVFEESTSQPKKDVLYIGLTSNDKNLSKRIEKRVQKRIKQGFEEELEGLLQSGVDWKDQSMSSLGYRQWQGCHKGNIPKQEAIWQWIQEERKYMKRQKTWFKKNKRIKWFDISEKGYKKNVENMVRKWHNVNRK